MRIYVVGALVDVERVRSVQDTLVRAGHSITLDWTRGQDAGLRDYAGDPAGAAAIATEDLHGVLAASAVVVVASGSEGLGMHVETGAALGRAVAGELDHLVVVGPGRHDSAFYFHPLVQRFPDVEEWLDSLSVAGRQAYDRVADLSNPSASGEGDGLSV